MIAIAIVGVLVAVAIPQYQSYIARSQASEAVTLLSSLKAPVLEHYSVTGDFPSAADLGSFVKAGTYVSSITGSGATGGADATYEAKFAKTGVSAALSEKTVQMVFKSSGEVECKAGTISAELLPSACS
ncbi:pilin [Endozoicomonas atrinae]|uniref:pilin n=1 Tax=Endozoicomonas atrinae TaxID=1333660 RepID=UPI003AFFA84A